MLVTLKEILADAEEYKYGVGLFNHLDLEMANGIIEAAEEEGYEEIAEPIGIIAGVTPVTNPTSTTMFKSLIAAKTDCINISPFIFLFVYLIYYTTNLEILQFKRNLCYDYCK